MNKLKELREKKGEAKTDVAKVANVSSMTVARWESGESQIKPDKAQILADYFKVRVDYLLGYSSIADPELYKLMVKANTSDKISSIDKIIDDSAKSLAKNKIYNIKKDRFITFLWENNLILSDPQIDNVFKLISDLDLNKIENLSIFEKTLNINNALENQNFINQLTENGYQQIFDYNNKVLPRLNEIDKL